MNRHVIFVLVAAVFALLLSGGPAAAQTDKVRSIAPLPIPGGDVITPLIQIHQFLAGPLFDGQDAEPNGITNFNGTFAQVYMGGHAVDSAGATWDVDVDTRVYQGEYVGVNNKMHAHGTFVEI